MEFAREQFQRAQEHLEKMRPLVSAYERLNKAYRFAQGDDPKSLTVCRMAGAAELLEQMLQDLETE